jgi:membrane protein
MKFLRTFFIPLANKIAKDELFTRAAAVSYSASLALAPIIMLIASFLGLLRLDLIHHLAIQTNRLVGYEVGELVLSLAEYSKNNVQFASLSGLFGIIVLLISGSFLFNQVENTMAHIFKDFINSPDDDISYIRYARILLKEKFFSIVIFVASIFIALTSVFLSFYLGKTLGRYYPAIYTVVYEIGTFLIFSILFFIIYRSTPAKQIKNRSIFFGSMITALLFLVGKEMIALYISTTGIGSIYGAAGSIVIFLVWVYYSSLTIFLGAEIIAIRTLKKSDKLKSSN